MPHGEELGLSPGDIVLDGSDGTQLPSSQKGHSSLPNFRPMSIVAKGSPISATAEHLF